MKLYSKILIFVLVIVCAFTTVSSVSAVENIIENSDTATVDEASKDEQEYFCQDAFVNRYLDGDYCDLVVYEELYYNRAEDESVTWVLMNAYSFEPQWVVTAYITIDDVLIRKNPQVGPFEIGYGVYDVESDEFLTLDKVLDNPNYANLLSVIRELQIGEIIGDMDRDRKLTVKDATFIQKALADLIGFPESDMVHDYDRSYNYTVLSDELAFVSDFNRDGKRDIKDATAIQKYIAEI